MIYLVLIAIVLSLIGYVFTIIKTVKIQDSVIKEQKDVILREKIKCQAIQEKMEFYYRGYVNAASNIRLSMTNNIQDVQPIGSGEKGYVIEEYELDDILNEISRKGIKNIDKDKLEFLRRYGKK